MDITQDLSYVYVCHCGSLLPFTARKVSLKTLKSSCTALVPYGAPYTMWSTVGISFNRLCRQFTCFPKRIRSQLVGHLLGDGAL